MLNIIIEKATPDHISGIQALAQAVYSHDMAKTHPANAIERLLERLYNTASLQRTLNSKGATLLVAHDNDAADTVVGLCHFGSPLLDDCLDRKEIHRLFVHLQRRRAGMGGQLINAMVDVLRAQIGIRRCGVYLAQYDVIGQQFYGKYGFVHQPNEDEATTDPEDKDEQYWVKIL